jgi:hypothetical protein
MGQQRTGDGIPLASCRTRVAQPCMFLCRVSGHDTARI